MRPVIVTAKSTKRGSPVGIIHHATAALVAVAEDEDEDNLRRRAIDRYRTSYSGNKEPIHRATRSAEARRCASTPMESRMPKYRFVTDDGKKVDRGEDTLEFPNDGAAADAAQQALADMAQDALPNGQSLDLSAAVESSAGDEVYHASLKFRGETADQARAKAMEIDAGADDATDAVARALSANLKKPLT